tara:strand:+ start:2305 stop:2436 length:132 start_codon:yes stop_codon:yes gene_type:complete
VKKIKHNPVAKHAPKFNKAQVHKDKTKYDRKNKTDIKNAEDKT